MTTNNEADQLAILANDESRPMTLTPPHWLPMDIAQRRFDHPDTCPLCERPTFRMLPCADCGPWWMRFDCPGPAGPYMIPAELLPACLDALGLRISSLLDIGGGGGRLAVPAWAARGCVNHTVLDIWPHSHDRGDVFVVGDGCDAATIFGDKNFDVVIACEVLEHLPKERGPVLLDAVQRVARKLCALTTPNGYSAQEPGDTDTPWAPWKANPYQRHLCGWKLHETAALGWNVYANALREDGCYDACQHVAWCRP